MEGNFAHRCFSDNNLVWEKGGRCGISFQLKAFRECQSPTLESHYDNFVSIWIFQKEKSYYLQWGDKYIWCHILFCTCENIKVSQNTKNDQNFISQITLLCRCFQDMHLLSEMWAFRFSNKFVSASFDNFWWRLSAPNDEVNLSGSFF